MPSPAGTPGTAAVLISLGAQHPGPARGEVNVIQGGRRVAGNSGQPGRSVTSKTVAILAGPRFPSASVEFAAPPSVEELRQVVPVSDMRGRLGAGPARYRWRAATGYQRRPPAARCLGADRRTLCCRQPPKQARGSVDKMRILTAYRPPRLGRSPTWNSHSTDPRRPAPFSSTPLNRPPPWRPAYFALLPVDLPANRWRLLTYTCSESRLRSNAAAEDEGVLL